MKKAIGVLSFVLVVSLSLQSQQQSGKDLSWAFPVKNGDLPPEDASPKTVPGSTKTYSQAQIEDLSNPPDWFPDEHAPAPQIVHRGHDDALACGACHLMSGFKHGSRNGGDAQLMKKPVAEMSDADIVAIAAYLGSLNPGGSK